MQKTFSFQGAGEIHFGCGVINQLPDLSTRYGSVRFCWSWTLFFPGDLLKIRLFDDLKTKGLTPILFDQIEPEPSPASAEAGARLARRKACSLVIGIGGGSTLDTAKAVAMLALIKGRSVTMSDLDLVPKPGLPTISGPDYSRDRQ